MFSSGALVHIVFANANDTYYCNHVMALEQDQYLWLRLREEGFGEIFFLDIAEICTVRRYGAPPEYYNITKKKESKNLQELIRSQMQKKNTERGAFICRLPDFCEAFARPQWLEFLSGLRSLPQRTGIIVLVVSPEAEASKPYLLTSPVFDALKVTAVTDVRTAEPCGLFGFLLQKMPEDAVFLNVYSKAQILSILRYLFMTDPERSDGYTALNAVTEYLYQYLHNQTFRHDEAQHGIVLPEKTALFQNMLAALRNLDWNQLTARVDACVSGQDISRYLLSRDWPYVSEMRSEPGVLRAEGTYAHRCLMLSIPDSAGEYTEKLQELLADIRAEVTVPKNRMENSRIADTVRGLLDHADSACHTRDFATLRRILESVDFCISWINVMPGSSEEQALLVIAKQLIQYVGCSSEYSKLCESLSEEMQLSGVAKLIMEKNLTVRDALKDELERYDEFFNARRLQMAMNRSLGGLSSLTDGLESIQKDITDTLDAAHTQTTDLFTGKIPAAAPPVQKAASAAQKAEPAAKKAEPAVQKPAPPAAKRKPAEISDEYVLRPEDDDFIPPSFN